MYGSKGQKVVRSFSLYDLKFADPRSNIKLYHTIMDRLKTFLLLFVFFSLKAAAQNTMRINCADGNMTDIPIGQIDSISFIEKTVESIEASVTGGWFWGSQEQGYYEVLTFNEDHTYTGYDNYFSYGFNTMTYGWYLEYGNLLTLQSNGFGYNRKYTWLVTGLTENALEVMTKMGSFTYYKLQPEVIMLNVNEETSCPEDGSVVFADGIIVRAEEDKLIGLIEGTTYILIRRAIDDKIVAYKIVVK